MGKQHCCDVFFFFFPIFFSPLSQVGVGLRLGEAMGGARRGNGLPPAFPPQPRPPLGPPRPAAGTPPGPAGSRMGNARPTRGAGVSPPVGCSEERSPPPAASPPGSRGRSAQPGVRPLRARSTEPFLWSHGAGETRHNGEGTPKVPPRSTHGGAGTRGGPRLPRALCAGGAGWARPAVQIGSFVSLLVATRGRTKPRLSLLPLSCWDLCC